MLKLLDVVKLKNDREDVGVKASFIGTVVDVLENGEAYTVEFTDENKETIMKSLYTTFNEDELVKIWST